MVAGPRRMYGYTARHIDFPEHVSLVAQTTRLPNDSEWLIFTPAELESYLQEKRAEWERDMRQELYTAGRQFRKMLTTFSKTFGVDLESCQREDD